MVSGPERLRVLVLSRNYPNRVMPLLALWVERPTLVVSRTVDLKVVSPVPWWPPLLGNRFPELARFRQIPSYEIRQDIEVFHPRFLVGPGQYLHGLEADSYLLSARREVEGLHRHYPFDLIHAHFSYPDGVVAARLGARFEVPVVVTEHAPWVPWMNQHPRVRSLTRDAAADFAAHLAVSRAVKETILEVRGPGADVQVVPIGVDGQCFRPTTDNHRDRTKVLYVGMPRAATKGLDVLFDAMTDLFERHPSAHLTLVGGAVYRDANAHIAQLERRAQEGPLKGRVEFTGALRPEEVARHMATSAVLVLPSMLESFGAVLIEALACGTPVVSTRCGGPEDIVVDEVGRLVPVGDALALSRAVEDVLEDPHRYPVERLRHYALSHFSWDIVAERILSVYRGVLKGRSP